MKPSKLDLKSLSDIELVRIRSDLIQEHNQTSSRLKTLIGTLARIKEELKRRRLVQEKPFVSDHAIVRYLERVEGVNVEAIRDYIDKKIPINPEVTKSNGIILNEFMVKLSKDGKAITTILSKDMVDKLDEEPCNEGAVQEYSEPGVSKEEEP